MEFKEKTVLVAFIPSSKLVQFQPLTIPVSPLPPDAGNMAFLHSTGGLLLIRCRTVVKLCCFLLRCL